MFLRVKKHLGVDDILRCCLRQISISEVIEILAGEQNLHAVIINRQKAWQIMEGIAGLHRRNIGKGQRQSVALGQRKFHLGLKRAL